MGKRWNRIAAFEIPLILLVRNGTLLPLVRPSQNTSEIKWKIDRFDKQ